jgi:cobalt-zinc-cadmium efflux system membrane fusion protein
MADAHPKLRSAPQFLIATGVTLAFLVYLLAVPPTPREVVVDASPRESDDVVEALTEGLIRVKPGGPMEKKWATATVREERRSDALFTVPGRVVASLHLEKKTGTGAWQFDSPEMLTIYSEWQKARSDIDFAETQLEQVKALGAVRQEAQQQVVARLQKLVAAGTDTVKDLTAEKANLLQIEIAGKKDIHENQTAVRVAKRNEAVMARQLQQAGLDPELLKATAANVDIVMAEVPEGKLRDVKVGDSSRAEFAGLPGRIFPGKVNSIAPVLSKERRSLRVLFTIDDRNDELRPGMFAEIGISTDPHDIKLMPVDGILHIGRLDYALVRVDAETWRAVPVQIGEPHGTDIEILSGLKAGDQVIGRGAILLRPAVLRSLEASSKEAS